MTAAKVKHFIETYCVQSRSPWNGQTVKLLPWQWHDLINPLYGTIDDDGNRQYKKAALFISKKQGKSTLLSCLALYHLLESPGNEVYIIAGSTEQAGIIFKEACNMVEAHPELAKRLWARRNIKQIEDKKNHSFVKVLPLKPGTAQGWNASAIIYDEICFWQPAHYAREIVDQLSNATMARKNGLQFFLSTAGWDRSHIGYEIYQYAKKVKENPEIDKHFLPVIYEVPQTANWHDENEWIKACPSMNLTVPIQHYRDEYAKLKHNPHGEAAFRTLLLSQWFDGGSAAFIPSHIWDKNKEDFHESDFYNEQVWVGLDAARKFDIASYVIIAQRNENLYLIPRIFIANDTAQVKEKSDNVPYLSWSKDKRNNLYLTPGDEIDIGYIREKLIEDSKRFKFASVGFDATFLQETNQALGNEYGLPVVNVTQNWSVMSPATGLFERMVIAGKIKHNNNPVMNWSLANCVTKESAGQIMIEKKRCRNRVDIITAAIIGLQRWNDKVFSGNPFVSV